MLKVSDPQPIFAVTELTVKGYVKWLRDRGIDVHEFAKSYVDRTEQLGYPPSLADSVQEFVSVVR
jgi:hypothetical protein